MGHLKNLEHKKRQLSTKEAQNLLKEEILELEKELEGHTVVRFALEKAMNCQPLVDDPTYKSLSEPDENFIKEIALLELEVVYLEKYLLSMYRRSFAKRLTEKPKSNLDTHNWNFTEVAKSNLASVNEESTDMRHNEILGAETLVDTGIYRSHSSLSQHSACSFRSSFPFEGVAELSAVDSYHSLPLSMLERVQNATSNASLEEYLGSNLPDRDWETPNWLSEEIIKCIATIYCHLSDTPLINHGFSSISHSSPPTKFPFDCEEYEEFSGSLSTMVEIQGINRDSQRLNAVEDLLDNFRFLVSRLEQVDPGKLKHEEKIAFWINIHNALVMHAYLVYGIPQGNLKRITLALKAAYNIGGHTVSVDRIQSSILRCRLPRPSQWLHSLFFPKAKFKAGDPRKTYAIKHPEPRLHFALCSGCKSDAAVRIYTSKKVFQELEMAKEEHIQMNIRLHKEHRLLVPKNVEYFVKEMGLSPRGIVEILEHSMPHSLRNKGKFWKKIDWIPHNFAFSFMLSNELIR